MKATHPIRLAATTLLGVALLAACGGGDDDLSGGQTAFTIVPEEVTITGPAPDVCPGGATGIRVQIIGGSPPYQIFTNWPTLVIPSTTVVPDQAGFFNVDLGPGCFESLSVTIRDAQNRLAIFSATAEEGQ